MNTSIALAHRKIAFTPVVCLCLAATWLIWGSMYLAIKWALDSFPPFYQMGTQFVIAGFLLGGWSLWKGGRLPNARQWMGATILGALLLGGGYGFTALAQTGVGSGLVVAFNAIVPTLIAIAELPYGVRPSRIRLVGIVLGLTGIVLLSQGQGFGASPLGLASMCVACVTWTLGSVWAVHGLPGGARIQLADGFMGHASQMLVGGILLLLGAWLAGEHPVWPPDTRGLLSWIYLMVCGSLISYTAYMVLLERTTPGLAASYTYVNPVVAMTLGVALGDELVTGFEWTAVVIVLTGVVLLMWRRD